MSDKSSVPALERGLDVLELLSDGGEMASKDVVDALEIPPASAARILKSLLVRGYLTKAPETGKYGLGPAAIGLAQPVDPAAALRQAGEPVLRQLRDALNQTAILFYWTGIAWECIGKESHEDALTMQTVGEIRVDIFDYPWGVFAYEQVSGEDRRLVLQVNHEKMGSAVEAFRTDGYAIGRGGAFSRLAVPIKSQNDELLGALAVGVMRSVMEELTEPAVADLLISAGKQLEERLRGGTQNY